MKIYTPVIVITTILFLSACASAAPTQSAEPSATAAPDPCAQENISASTKNVSDLQREFDDASALAANLPREQLASVITDMQRIRRAAEDQETPPCLVELKKLQLSHMNTVINTLIAFVGGADQTTLTEGIARARQEHDQYSIELARLLGITLTPLTPQSVTPAP